MYMKILCWVLYFIGSCIVLVVHYYFLSKPNQSVSQQQQRLQYNIPIQNNNTAEHQHSIHTYITMPEIDGVDTVEQESKNDPEQHSPRKRIRHRKKQLYASILKQMEFYFSEANLSKDRFLGDLVRNDPWVPLELFLKFNKIRSLSQDLNDIAKAMKHSTLLELSEDRTKVRRKDPLQPYDADERTVYVESIPVSATREWLERVFSEYGSIAYISLPKFKNSKTIKGFAFIEFTKPEDAQKCIRVFTEMGCKLPNAMAPEELSSIKLFSIDEPPNINFKDSDKEDEPPKKKKKKEKRPTKGLDLKLGQDSDSEKKLDTPTDDNKSIDTPTEETKTLQSVSKDDLTSHDEGDTETPRKKKARKRTKEKNKAFDKSEAPKGALWGMQILPKAEWKALRNKYLNLQRQYMKEMKQNWRSQRHAYSNIPAPAAPSCDTVIPSSEGEDSKTVAKLEKISGAFVKEILPDPTFDVRLTKRTIRSNVHALHVDVKEGQAEVIIRFDSAKAAQDYCSNSSNLTCILSGAAEAEQWARAEAAHAAHRPRGRCRLAARAAQLGPAPATPASPVPTITHIRFDE